MGNGYSRYRRVFMGVLVLLPIAVGGCSGGEQNPAKEVPRASISFDYKAEANYYTEKFRPQYHLSPEKGNMSDPNGMVYFDGEYHQFYQNSGKWGHAVSKDLLHWEHLPVALDKDKLGDIWSGSAVVDWKDTSGFFSGKPGLVAVFTHFKNGLQSQSIAYSTDKGRTWTKYEGNPVIPNPGLKDFRDPKVLWHEPTKSWVMVVSVDQKIRFYSSPDLKHWTMTSEFGAGQGSHAAVWECPDLFELPVEGTDRKKWVLAMSIGNNPHTNGSTAQYFIGSFDGKTFVNENKPSDVLWTDYGKDFYAAVSFSDIPAEDGRRIWVGWMSNWRYPFAMPTGMWKGNMSVYRELKLRDVPGEGLRLVQQPVRELETLRGKERSLKKQRLSPGKNPLADIRGTSFELETEFTLQGDHEFGIKLRKGGGQETVIRYKPQAAKLEVDRTKSGISDFEARFAERIAAPLKPRDQKIKLRILADDSTLEVFGNDGEAVISTILFPDPTSNEIELFCDEDITLNQAVYYPMRTVWRDEEPDGSKPMRVVLNKSILHLSEGKQEPLAASVLPLGAKQKVKWVSSDESVVKLEKTGDATASAKGLKEGKAEIQAVSEDGGIRNSIIVYVAAEDSKH